MKEQLKKLSDLKENEYVYCDTIGETKRIFNTERAFRLYNNKGESCLLEDIAEKGTFIVHPSKDIADYEPPVPVRPKHLLTFVASEEVISHIYQLNDYTDHLEKELEEVKSKAFVPFKVKCIDGSDDYDVTIGNQYEVMAENDDSYCVLDDMLDLVVMDKGYFTKTS